MRIHFVLLFCVTLALFSKAQTNNSSDTLPEKYITLYITEVRTSTRNYTYGSNRMSPNTVSYSRNLTFKVGNGKEQKIGFYGRNLKPHVMDDPMAFKYFRKYQNSRIGNNLCIVSMFGTGIGAILFYNKEHTVGPGTIGLGVACLGSMALYYVTQARYEKMIELSVNTYNDNLIKKVSYWRKLKPDAMCIVPLNLQQEKRFSPTLGIAMHWNLN